MGPLMAILAATLTLQSPGFDPFRSGDYLETGLVCLDSTFVYNRPDSSAGVFGLLNAGDSLTVSSVTSDGWLGFDPGIAQAGNIGSFRYRWIPPSGSYALCGQPGLLPEVWAPEPGVVYAMFPEDTPLLASPDHEAQVLDSISGGSAAEVTLRTAGWLEVNALNGPFPRDVTGWVDLSSVSVSGEIDSVPLQER